MGSNNTFVEIEIVPPLHSHNIAEPHMGNLVRLSGSNSLLSGQIRLCRIDQERARSTCNQALGNVRSRTKMKALGSYPVLHGTFNDSGKHVEGRRVKENRFYLRQSH